MPLSDAAFDVVFCQLALQFFADKAAALREIRRVLAPGGRAYASVPAPTAFFDVLKQAVTHHVGAAIGVFVQRVFSLNDGGELEGLFRNAGFDEVHVRMETRQLRVPAARDFLWQYVHSTPLAGAIGELNVEGRAAGRFAWTTRARRIVFLCSRVKSFNGPSAHTCWPAWVRDRIRSRSANVKL